MSLPNPLVVLGGVGSPYTRKMLSYLRYKRIPHKMIWGDPSKYLDQEGIEKPKPGLLPTFVLPDENGNLKAVTDSTPLIRRIDEEVNKLNNSININEIDFSVYDIVFLAGGWGAAYDLGFSDTLAAGISKAYYSGSIIGAICHGPLGLIKSKDKNGNILIAGRKMTGVTDKQVKELNITMTPLHPEEELKKAGALFEAKTKFLDQFAYHVVVDDEKRFVTGQNQNSGHETAQRIMEIIEEAS